MLRCVLDTHFTSSGRTLSAIFHPRTDSDARARSAIFYSRSSTSSPSPLLPLRPTPMAPPAASSIPPDAARAETTRKQKRAQERTSESLDVPGSDSGALPTWRRKPREKRCSRPGWNPVLGLESYGAAARIAVNGGGARPVGGGRGGRGDPFFFFSPVFFFCFVSGRGGFFLFVCLLRCCCIYLSAVVCGRVCVCRSTKWKCEPVCACCACACT